MKKLFLISIFILAIFLTVSSVSASENATDVFNQIDDAPAEDVEIENAPDLDNVLSQDVESIESEFNSSQVMAQENDAGDENSIEVMAQANDVNDTNSSDTLSKKDDSTENVVESSQNAVLSVPLSSAVVGAKAPAKVTPKLVTSKSSSYESFKTKLTFKLTAKGKNLAKQRIKISIAGKRYVRITDSKGIASLLVYLKKGSRFAHYIYSGNDKVKRIAGKFTVCTGEAIKTYLRVLDWDINYREGSRFIYRVKLIDAKGNAMKYKNVVFNIGGKVYKAKTTVNGYANIRISLKQGYHLVHSAFYPIKPYKKSIASSTIYVKEAMGKGNGYWVWTDNMYNLDFGSLRDQGTTQLFLHVHSISVYGYSAVQSWIYRANSYGMKVHLWMQVCYSDGGWVSPVNDDGSFKYGFINDKIDEAVGYAQMDGVAGVHLDYMRYGGTAHKHINAVESINYIVKRICEEVRNVRPNCIVSVAVMPEPDMMHYYYGQDIPTLSKYVDVILPMSYCGNYGQPTEWITSVTNTFTKQSFGAQIWAGLQGYESDSNAVPLSHSEVLDQARAAQAGGAAGSVIFRHGYSPNLNFNWV